MRVSLDLLTKCQLHLHFRSPSDEHLRPCPTAVFKADNQDVRWWVRPNKLCAMTVRGPLQVEPLGKAEIEDLAKTGADISESVLMSLIVSLLDEYVQAPALREMLLVQSADVGQLQPYRVRFATQS